MEPPIGESLQPEYEELLERVKKAGQAKAAVKMLIDFAGRAADLSLDSQVDRATHGCLIRWLNVLEKADQDYRVKMGIESNAMDLADSKALQDAFRGMVG